MSVCREIQSLDLILHLTRRNRRLIRRVRDLEERLYECDRDRRLNADTIREMREMTECRECRRQVFE
jgi:hypothetical protein